MSEPMHPATQPPTQPPTRQADQRPAKPPIVRLPTWVNVVLVLILLASCGAADHEDPYVDTGSIATAVVSQLQSQNGWGSPAGPASAAEVEDLCRLLGAVAAREKVPLTVMQQDEPTRCHDVAQEAAQKAAASTTKP